MIGGSKSEIWRKVVRKCGAVPCRPRAARPDAAMMTPRCRRGNCARAVLRSKPDLAGRVEPVDRDEYTNAIRDLLDLDVDGRGGAAARHAGYGFDNIGESCPCRQGYGALHARGRQDQPAALGVRRSVDHGQIQRRIRCCCKPQSEDVPLGSPVALPFASTSRSMVICLEDDLPKPRRRAERGRIRWMCASPHAVQVLSGAAVRGSGKRRGVPIVAKAGSSRIDFVCRGLEQTLPRDGRTAAPPPTALLTAVPTRRRGATFSCRALQRQTARYAEPAQVFVWAGHGPAGAAVASKS